LLLPAKQLGTLKQGILAVVLLDTDLGSALGGAADAINPQIAGAEQALAGCRQRRLQQQRSDLARSQAAQSRSDGQSAQRCTIGGLRWTFCSQGQALVRR
jgi:hypothetical protein